MEDRIKKAIKYTDRVFDHKDFDNSKKSLEITKDIVISSVSVKFSNNNKSPCWEAALLSRDQEQHLFKQMNYYKYKAKKLLSVCKISEKRLEKAESLIEKSKKIRNKIAESNFRLVSQLLRCNVTFYQKHSLIDSLISDGYMDVLKAVDYFDWRRGNKFSTYATWVIKKNFFRDSKIKQKQASLLTSLDKHDVDLVAKSNGVKEEQEYENQKEIVQNLLLSLRDSKSSNQRLAQIVELYFGLNGSEKQTLEKISAKLSITKERVRQLKEKALNWLKIEAQEQNYDFSK